MNVNCRSVLNKAEALESLLLGLDPHFAALTETWLTNEVLDNEIAPPNYTVVRKDRPTRGRGVALLIKNDIPFTVLPEVEDVEAVFCKLKLGSCSIIVGCCYRSPSAGQEFMPSLSEYMERHVLGSRLVLLGDFNFPDINWQTMQFNSASSEALIDTMLRFNLSQIVHKPTRIQGHCSSILDLVLLGDYFPSQHTRFETLDGISDDMLIFCTVPFHDVQSTLKSRITYPDFSSADHSSILNHLNIELDAFRDLSATPSIDIDSLWRKFKAIIHQCMKNHVPTRTKKTKQNNPWITRDIIHAKRKVKRLRKRLKLNPTPLAKNNLRNAIDDMKGKIKKEKTNYFTTTLPNFLKNSPIKFWDYLKPKKSNKTQAPEKESQVNADSLNRYFKSVFTVDNGNLPHIEYTSDKRLGPLTITEHGILNLLLELDTKKAVGPDNIPNIFLVRYAKQIAKYLCIVFDKSL